MIQYCIMSATVTAKSIHSPSDLIHAPVILLPMKLHSFNGLHDFFMPTILHSIRVCCGHTSADPLSLELRGSVFYFLILFVIWASFLRPGSCFCHMCPVYTRDRPFFAVLYLPRKGHFLFLFCLRLLMHYHLIVSFRLFIKLTDPSHIDFSSQERIMSRH
jgi:hypothetical protein